MGNNLATITYNGITKAEEEGEISVEAIIDTYEVTPRALEEIASNGY